MYRVKVLGHQEGFTGANGGRRCSGEGTPAGSAFGWPRRGKIRLQRGEVKLLELLARWRSVPGGLDSREVLRRRLRRGCVRDRAGGGKNEQRGMEAAVRGVFMRASSVQHGRVEGHAAVIHDIGGEGRFLHSAFQ
jgi:hypothetical protein